LFAALIEGKRKIFLDLVFQIRRRLSEDEQLKLLNDRFHYDQRLVDIGLESGSPTKRRITARWSACLTTGIWPRSDFTKKELEVLNIS
jgi:hypothetical protein